MIDVDSSTPHLWLLDPEMETVEEYILAGQVFNKTGQHGAGTHFRPALFPEQSVAVDSLFDTQAKRHGSRRSPTKLEPVPMWLVSSDQRVGLEVLFFFGHPEKRYEIWNNRAPCLLAFGSPEEAELRFGHFLDDICRWEQRPLLRPRPIEPGVEVAEAGRFQLTRRGSQIRLDVAVDSRKYRELLRVWTNRPKSSGLNTPESSVRPPTGSYPPPLRSWGTKVAWPCPGTRVPI